MVGVFETEEVNLPEQRLYKEKCEQLQLINKFLIRILKVKYLIKKWLKMFKSFVIKFFYITEKWDFIKGVHFFQVRNSLNTFYTPENG